MQKKFRLFRYQLIPNTSSENYSLFENVDDVVTSKNSLFMEALNEFSGFYKHPTEVNHRRILHAGDWHVGQIGFKRNTRLTDKNFSKKMEENFPSIFFIINNNPNEQLLIVQDVSGLMKPTSFARKLTEYINELLVKQPVEMQVESIVEKSEFWDEIRKAQGKIVSVEFRIDTPNMARISKVLPERLKALTQVTNSKNSTVRLNGDKDRKLDISEKNADIQGLNSYVSEGGGDYKIKVSGIKREITKNDSVKTVFIDEITIEHANVDALNFALEAVLEND